MYIVGSARNNGVKFTSDNYTARFVMDKNGGYKVSHGERTKLRASREYMRKIPVIRGIYAALYENPFSALIALVLMFAEFCDYYGSSAGYVFLAITCALAVGCLVYFVSKVLYRIGDVWTFHGAKHKVMYSYEIGEKLTLENARKNPRFAKGCEINLAIFVIVFYLLFSISISSPGLKYILSFALGYELFRLDGGDKYPVLKLFFKLGYWLQQKVFTKEPSDVQLIATIDAMRTLVGLEPRLSRQGSKKARPKRRGGARAS